MGVKKVWGEVNGHKVNFIEIPNEPNRYQATGIPTTINGVYVMQIFAQDEIGNVSVVSKIETMFKDGKIVNDPNMTSLREENAFRRGGILNAGKVERTIPD